MDAWSYLKFSLITSFGGRSGRPLRSAIVRLLIITAVTVSITASMMPAIRQLPVAPELPDLWWWVVMAVGLQILCAAVILMAQAVLPSQTALEKILLYLPISNLGRWTIIYTPALVLTGLILAMVAQPLLLIIDRVGLNPALAMLAVFGGIASGFGIATYRRNFNFLARLAILGLLVADEILVLRQLLNTGNSVWYWSLGFLLVVPTCWSVTRFGQVANEIQENQTRKAPLLTFRSLKLWYLAKYLRNKRILSSLVVALILSCSVAALIARHGLPIGPNNGLWLFCAVLAGAIASDVRGVIRKNAPPEIVALNGTVRLVTRQSLGALILGTAAVLPIFLAVFMVGRKSPTDFLHFLSLIVFAVSVGTFISEALTPGDRDTTAQLIGAVVSTALILGLPRVMPSGLISNATAVYLILAGSLTGLTFLIELRRNNFKWSHRYAK